MSYRVLQLSPQLSTRTSRRRINVLESWTSPSANALDVGFLQSCFEDDSEFDRDEQDCTNWGAISGLALSIAFSASFWAGVGWAVARVWK
jgi:hypothetical protein